MPQVVEDAYIGEIRMFAGSFAPLGWAFCNGQILAISQNEALFSLIGNSYGGDGRTSFALPDLRGRVPVHQGEGSGLSIYPIGAKAGMESVTLRLSEMPVHNHPMQGSTNTGNSGSPIGHLVAEPSEGNNIYSSLLNPSNLKAMDARGIESNGGNRAHNNMQPFQVVSFIIAMYGIYPSRN
ncbi:phage tail protein [Arcobacter sp. YIC-310]|uniref:phage tail protein n=1 Tax=Arcobacter sp. YIC-310 TaxID=3376632 RepID=UPI003C13954F